MIEQCEKQLTNLLSSAFSDLWYEEVRESPVTVQTPTGKLAVAHDRNTVLHKTNMFFRWPNDMFVEDMSKVIKSVRPSSNGEELQFLPALLSKRVPEKSVEMCVVNFQKTRDDGTHFFKAMIYDGSVCGRDNHTGTIAMFRIKYRGKLDDLCVDKAEFHQLILDRNPQFFQELKVLWATAERRVNAGPYETSLGFKQQEIANLKKRLEVVKFRDELHGQAEPMSSWKAVVKVSFVASDVSILVIWCLLVASWIGLVKWWPN